MDRIDKNPVRHEGLTNQIIGVRFKVIDDLGGGFLESVYRKVLALALRQADLPSR